MKAKTHFTSKQNLMKKTSTSRKQSAITKQPEGKIKKIINSKQIQKHQKSFFEVEQSFRQLFEHMSSCVAIYTASANGKDFIVKAFNKAAEKADKIDRKKIIGKSVSQVFPGIKKFGLFKVFQQVWETGKPQHYPVAFYNDNRISGWRENYVYKLPSGEIVAIYNDITKQKQAENDLKESETRFRNIIEKSKDGIIFFDGKTQKIVSGNTAMVKLIGCSEEELLDRSISSLHPSEEWKNIEQKFQKHVSGKISLSKEIPILRDDGSILYADISSSPITIDGIKYFSAFFHDITDRKKSREALRESEERYRTLFEKTSNPILIIDKQGNYIDGNDSALRFLECTREELLTKKVRDTIPKGEIILKKLKQLWRSGGQIERAYNVHGKIKYLDLTISLFMWNGRHAVLGVGTDITQRKQAEEALGESEQKYKLLVENIHDWIWEIAEKGVYTYVSPRAQNLLGYRPEELLGKTPFKFMPPKEAKRVGSVFKQLMASRQPLIAIENMCTHKDGNFVIFETSGMPFFDTKGQFKGYRGVNRDITDRKITEELLKERRDTINAIVETSQEWIWAMNTEGEHTYSNQAIEKILGYRVDEIIGYSSFDFLHEEDKKAVESILREAREKRRGWNNLLLRWRHKDGTYRYLESNSATILNDKGKLLGFRGVDRDITDRKEAEFQREAALEALQESEKNFHRSLDDSPMGIRIVTVKGETLYANQAILEMYGYEKIEEMRRTPLKERYTPESYAEFQIRKKNREKGELGTDEYEISIVRKNGEIRHVHVFRKEVIWNGTKQFQIIYRDITKHKNAETALHKSEEKYRSILENIEDGYYEVDIAGNFTFFNDSICRIWGYPKEELMGMNNQQYTDKENAKKLFQAFNEVYRTEKPAKGFDWQIIRKDGTNRYIEASVSLLKDSSDKPKGFRGIVRDITERKLAEEELLKSEEKYRSLVENAQEGIYQTSPEGRHLTLNPAFVRMLGYDSPEEAMQAITDIARQLYVNPDDRKKLFDLVEEKGSVTDFETEFYKKDGSRISVSVNINAVRNNQGRILYYQGIYQDITERKKIETERQENIERLRKSLGATINAMAVTVETRDPYTAGHQRRVADLARAIATEMNLGRDKIDGVRMASMIHDIGKISIPSEILTKPTALTNLEFNLIKTHPESGYNILKDIEFPWPIARIVLEHHERINGVGYPKGLKGEQILMESRIVAVADVVEAISSHRPYRAAYSIDVGLDEITKNRGTLYDADVVDACLQLFREKNYTLAA